MGAPEFPEEATSNERLGTVQSVERAISLLEVLAEHGSGMRLREITAVAELSRSTTHRLLTTLEKRHFVQFNRHDGRWYIGRQAYLVASAFVHKRAFVASAIPYMRRLRDLTHETANLGIAEGHDVVVLAQIESREARLSVAKVGGRMPIHCSGMGKAILAAYPEKEVRAVIANMAVSTDALGPCYSDDLHVTRRRAYAIDDEGLARGVRCVASVVYGANSEPLCAISVSGHVSRLTDERIEAVGPLVSSVAQELTGALGGR
ncbi:IclR family transcriptional regulator [Chelativorans multitrophicus]|uniref:Transcriptional regulator, IclR family n=2 Tax=Pseudomonadota TaxID=1224 RepID=Q11H91_CHESB|nr:IclR family transcriptional regulator [Chelativorans multitrophicus]